MVRTHWLSSCPDPFRVTAPATSSTPALDRFPATSTLRVELAAGRDAHDRAGGEAVHAAAEVTRRGDQDDVPGGHVECAGHGGADRPVGTLAGHVVAARRCGRGGCSA